MEKFELLNPNKISELPKEPGVYAFKDKEILYIGKAVNIRERVKSHFQNKGFKEEIFLAKTKSIGYIKTDSEIEALILEANLIKKYQPKFNVLWRDDKNYFFVAITKEDFPRVFISHQKLPNTYHLKPLYTGPFVDGKALKETLKALRKISPFRSCKRIPKRACLWYTLKRCPGPCLLKGKLASQIPKSKIKRESKEHIENLLKILKGEKIGLLKKLEKEMRIAVKKQDFERAARIRDKIFSLEKVLANSKVLRIRRIEEWSEIEKKLKKILEEKKEIKRVEAYDISNIQGKNATGSMVVFENGKMKKSDYRRFKIKISGKPNDIAMLKECLSRRFKHKEWGFPDLILIDGGKAQLNVAKKAIEVLNSKSPKPKIIALAKRRNQLYLENQKRPTPLDSLSDALKFFILRVNNEAHRFAIQYHRKLREKQFIP